jgi:hypothetical protein
MTKVKKTKKLKAKKSGKKPVTKKPRSNTKPVFGSASVEKIDRRLRPTPESKLIKIDPMLKNPLKIVDVPRSQIYPYQQIPTYMFSGQDTGNLNRQFDILKSKEQQLEAKVTQIQQKGLYDEILRDMRILDNNMSILDNEYSKQKYDGLKKRLMEINRTIPKDEPSLFLFYEKLSERLEAIKKSYDEFELDAGFSEIDFGEIPEGEDVIFKEVKSTNTLLDDKIHNNNLVDEAEILMEEIKSKEVKGSINLPSFEAVELLGEMQSSKIKSPVYLPTFEEALKVVKKTRGRPKKEKVNELVEVKQTNTLLDDVIIDNILDDVSASVGEEYDPQASTRRRQQFVNQARLELEQSERAFDEKMRLNSIRLGESVARAKERRGMMEEDEPYQTAMWRIVGTTKKRSDLLS